jgi:hypothetical protein
MNGGSGASNVTVENPIPVWAENEIAKYLSHSKQMAKDDAFSNGIGTSNTLKLYDYTGTIPNENDTYASRNQDEIDGIENLATRARNGSPIITSAKTLITDNVEGDNLGNNPNLDELYDVASENILQELDEEVLPSIEFEALSLNMFASSGFAIRQAQAAEKGLQKLLDISKSIYYDDYNSERNSQNSMLAYMINYGNESTRDAELLRQAGLYDREYEQGILTAAYREWFADQMHLIRKLEVLGNGVRAIVGAQYRKVVEPFYRPSDMSQIAGLAFAGAGVAASIYGANNNQGGLGPRGVQANKPDVFNLPKLTPDSLNRWQSDNLGQGDKNEQ